jgi:hypothetical protein
MRKNSSIREAGMTSQSFFGSFLQEGWQMEDMPSPTHHASLIGK